MIHVLGLPHAEEDMNQPSQSVRESLVTSVFTAGLLLLHMTTAETVVVITDMRLGLASC